MPSPEPQSTDAAATRRRPSLSATTGSIQKDASDDDDFDIDEWLNSEEFNKILQAEVDEHEAQAAKAQSPRRWDMKTTVKIAESARRRAHGIGG